MEEDFVLVGQESEDRVIWYNVIVNVSVYQIISEGIFLGWRGRSEDRPGLLEKMEIGESIREVLDGILSDREKRLYKFRR